jgi:hypothetical protein
MMIMACYYISTGSALVCHGSDLLYCMSSDYRLLSDNALSYLLLYDNAISRDNCFVTTV